MVRPETVKNNAILFRRGPSRLGGVFVDRLESRGMGQDSRLPRILAMIWATSGWAASGRR
jgi:hypothetical protein